MKLSNAHWWLGATIFVVILFLMSDTWAQQEAYKASQEFIKESLVRPGSARFDSAIHPVTHRGRIWVIKSYFDCEDANGQTKHLTYKCVLEYDGPENEILLYNDRGGMWWTIRSLVINGFVVY